MATVGGPRIVRRGLIYCLDAAEKRSYPGSGLNWYNLLNRDFYDSCFFYFEPVYINSYGGILDISNVSGGQFGGSITDVSTAYATYEVWIQLDYPNDNNTQFILQKFDDFYTDYIAKTSANRFEMSITDDLENSYYLTLNTLPSTKWVQLVLTYDGTYLKGYVNGILDKFYLSNGTGMFTSFFSYIMISPGGNEMLGKMAICRIYNRALSATEVLQNFNANKGRFGL